MTRNAGEFTDFLSFKKVDAHQQPMKGSIIKRNRVSVSGQRTIEIIQESDDRPSVEVHHNGDEVERLEFHCTCGRRLLVQLNPKDENPSPGS